jgi:hypothetical protein
MAKRKEQEMASPNSWDQRMAEIKEERAKLSAALQAVSISVRNLRNFGCTVTLTEDDSKGRGQTFEAEGATTEVVLRQTF